jgi:hypothetical protein
LGRYREIVPHLRLSGRRAQFYCCCSKRTFVVIQCIYIMICLKVLHHFLQ